MVICRVEAFFVYSEWFFCQPCFVAAKGKTENFRARAAPVSPDFSQTNCILHRSVRVVSICFLLRPFFIQLWITTYLNKTIFPPQERKLDFQKYKRTCYTCNLSVSKCRGYFALFYSINMKTNRRNISKIFWMFIFDRREKGVTKHSLWSIKQNNFFVLYHFFIIISLSVHMTNYCRNLS